MGHLVAWLLPALKKRRTVFLFIDSNMGVDEISYWKERWESGSSGWHSSAPWPPLVTHLPTLTGGAEGLKVLVPLCGKAGCLLYLYKAGHTVVGIEGVPSVVGSSSQRINCLSSRAIFLQSRVPSSALLMVASLCSSATSSTQLRNLLATSTQSGIADLLLRSASTLGLAMSPSLEVSWASLSGTCCKHGSMTRHCTLVPLTA